MSGLSYVAEILVQHRQTDDRRHYYLSSPTFVLRLRLGVTACDAAARRVSSNGWKARRRVILLTALAGAKEAHLIGRYTACTTAVLIITRTHTYTLDAGG